MYWPGGVKTPMSFASKEESYAAFKDLWGRKYGGFPTMEQAALYTGNDSPDNWLNIVTQTYYDPI